MTLTYVITRAACWKYLSKDLRRQIQPHLAFTTTSHWGKQHVTSLSLYVTQTHTHTHALQVQKHVALINNPAIHQYHEQQLQSEVRATDTFI